MKNHSLIATLKSLTGNPRGCVYTEPLWGIPFNLYTPYISIYMVAFGLSDTQIGLIVSVSWGFQIILALLSGVITDKLGRSGASVPGRASFAQATRSRNGSGVDLVSPAFERRQSIPTPLR